MAFSLALGWNGATAQLSGRLTDTLSDTLTLYVAGSLGEVSLNTSVTFNPSTLAFLALQGGASFTLFDVSVTEFLTIGPQTPSYNRISISGTYEDIAYRGAFKFGACEERFMEASACADWTWSWCEADMSTCVQFNDATGFSSIAATMTDLLLVEGFLGLRGYLDASLSFTADAKTFSPTLRVQPDWSICAEVAVLAEVAAGASPVELDSVSLVGLRGECTLGEGFTFTFAESFSEAKNGSLTGKAEYFERIGVSGPLPSYCGSQGTFDADVYFFSPPAPPGALFGIGLLTAAADLRITRFLALALEVHLPTTTEDWELVLTVRVLW
jgi:hypothetical protein